MSVLSGFWCARHFERHGEISPDGQWLAYESNESVQYQIWQTLPHDQVGKHRPERSAAEHHHRSELVR
jgi:hypothetical protein